MGRQKLRMISGALLAFALAGTSFAATEWVRESYDISGGRQLVRSTAVVDGLRVVNRPLIEVIDQKTGKATASMGLARAEGLTLENQVLLTGDEALSQAMGFLVMNRPGLSVGGPFTDMATEPEAVAWETKDGLRAVYEVTVPTAKPEPDVVRMFVDAETGDVLFSGSMRRSDWWANPTPTPSPVPTPAPDYKANVFLNTHDGLANGRTTEVTLKGSRNSLPLYESSSEWVISNDGTGSTGDSPSGDPLVRVDQDFRYQPIEGPSFDVPEFDVVHMLYHVGQVAQFWNTNYEPAGFPYPTTAYSNVAFESPNAYALGNTMMTFGDWGYYDLLVAPGVTQTVKVGDFAKDPDVIYHEYAHLVYANTLPNEYLYEATEAGSRNEGNSDFWSAVVSGDPTIGLLRSPVEKHLFYDTGSAHEAVRVLTDRLVYPTTPYDSTFTENLCLQGPIILGTAGNAYLARRGPEPHHGGRVWGAMLWSAYQQLGPLAADDVFAGLQATLPNSPLAGSVNAIYSVAPADRRAAWLGIFAKHGMSGLGMIEENEQVATIRTISISVGGEPTGGSFTLGFGDSFTSIPYNADNTTLAGAIQDITDVDRCDVVVTGASPAWVVQVLLPGTSQASVPFTANGDDLEPEGNATANESGEPMVPVVIFDEEVNIALFNIDENTGNLTTGGPLHWVNDGTSLQSEVVRPAELLSNEPVTHYYHFGMNPGATMSLSVSHPSTSAATVQRAVVWTYDLQGDTLNGFEGDIRPFALLTPDSAGNLTGTATLPFNPFSAYIVEIDFGGEGEYYLNVTQ
ncbi:PepSY domain-containing protein [bacterium]|nr:PepSY domain-containing protein [bacterium]